LEWIWIVAAIGIAIYFWQRSRAPKAPPRPISMASDQALVLATFRRELANYLVRLDPDRFLRFYQKAQQVENAIEKADKEEKGAQLTIITKRYSIYTDFDLVGTREHVLYADALSRYSVEDIEEHYLNLVKFQALQHALDPNWHAATSDKDLEHLREYVRKIKDTKFRQRLMAAVKEFDGYRRGAKHSIPLNDSRVPPSLAYETDVLAVYDVPDFAEIKYGFHFKDTNEFGLYALFYGDNIDETHESFYRSDRQFEAERHLDDLPGGVPI
jgi:hypothetical protein